MSRMLSVVAAPVLLGATIRGALAQERFVPVGVGGGGAMFAPAISPHDPNLMFVSCDMGGFYRTEDGGRHWQMIDFRITRGSTRCRPVFHPTDANTIFFAGKVSRDRGETWRALADPPPWRNARAVTEMGCDPENGRILLVGTNEGAFLSRDGGSQWKPCAGVTGPVVGFFVDPTSPARNRRVFVAAERGIFRSGDDGRTWQEKADGLPWLGIRSFAGAADERRTRSIMYCVIPSRNEGGRFRGGVYRSTDAGEHWEPVGGQGLNKRLGKVDRWGHGEIAQYRVVLVADGHPERVYVSNYGTGYWPPNHNTVYRSDDAGEHWRYIFNIDMRRPEEFNIVPGWMPFALVWEGSGPHHHNGLNICQSNPDILIYSSGELFVTTDGGERWEQRYTHYADGQEPPIRTSEERRIGRWESIGLEVTTTWRYCVDPFDHNRHYICYTDIGFAISEDGGRSWWPNGYVSGTPWRNTTYDLAFDPAEKGLVWAAMSNVHDIPHSTHAWADIHTRGPGGVCVSRDGGANWEVSSDGLPAAPCTSIEIDPTSPKGARTLYATIYGHGVYKSTDGAATWRRSSNGLPLDRNNHTLLVRRHGDGTLFCSISAARERRAQRRYHRGGLFRSTDGGRSWTDITAGQPFYWCNGFDFDPTNSRVLYLAAANNRENPREGGIWKTTDGGATWRQLLGPDDFAGKAGPEPDTVEGMFVTVDPRDAESVYLGTTAHGLWYTHDAGETWRQFDGIPFGSIHRVTFDPDDHDRVYVTTFGGGVWRGPRP